MIREELGELKWKDIEFDNGLIILSDVHVKAGSREIMFINITSIFCIIL